MKPIAESHVAGSSDALQKSWLMHDGSIAVGSVIEYKHE